MKVYTKTGDKGQTRLIGGCLVAKSDLRIESYGSVDELNSCLGLVASQIASDDSLRKLRTQLTRIQNELFNVGSLLACEDINLMKKLPQLEATHVTSLEQEIDAMTADLSELKNFILPGGHPLAALLHLGRTVCRRAERNTVKLYTDHREVEIAVIYLNRLSDYLFTAARWVNFKKGLQDVPWSK